MPAKAGFPGLLYSCEEAGSNCSRKIENQQAAVSGLPFARYNEREDKDVVKQRRCYVSLVHIPDALRISEPVRKINRYALPVCKASAILSADGANRFCTSKICCRCLYFRLRWDISALILTKSTIIVERFLSAQLTPVNKS